MEESREVGSEGRSISNVTFSTKKKSFFAENSVKSPLEITFSKNIGK